jgi:hypothetical protein
MSISTELRDIARCARKMRLLVSNSRPDALPSRILDELRVVEAAVDRAGRELSRIDGQGYGGQLSLEDPCQLSLEDPGEVKDEG